MVTARCFDAGLFPARDVRVRLALEGMAPMEQTVALSGHSRQLVRFEPPIKKPGLYHGFVEVGPGVRGERERQRLEPSLTRGKRGAKAGAFAYAGRERQRLEPSLTRCFLNVALDNHFAGLKLVI